MKNFLHELQNKPYETRIKILWGTTTVIALLVIGTWAVTIKDKVGNAGPISLTPPSESRGNQIESSYITIERAERVSNGLRIYFNVNNPTDDILSFSKPEQIEIKLQAGNKKPLNVLDRQGLPVLQKILSRTQVFGTLIFEDTEETEAQLVFDNMFFEKSPDQTLTQTIELDLKALIQNSEVRN